MAKMKVELDQTDIQTALAFWVDQGMPEASEPVRQRVTIRFSKSSGSDPREYDYHYATVNLKEGE
jgi:hypothetical protein